MKHLLFYIIIFAAASNVNAQMNKVSSTEELAKLLTQQQKDPIGRINAAYSWVTKNIRYSTDRVFAMNHGIDPRAKIDVAFRNRKGVCENFAAIFSDLCEKMDYPSIVIEGYVIQNNIPDRRGHSWSAVYVDNDWYLFDPTWDAGRATNFNYFKKSGNEFRQTHIPYDPMWQLMNYPSDNYGVKSNVFYNYKDSIDSYLTSDSLQKFESSLTRIQQAGTKNSLTEIHKKVLQNNIEIERQDEQMNWFDKAVNHLNRVSESLNDFIDERNQQFGSSTSDNDLKLMLSGISDKLDSAKLYLDNVDQSKATLVYGTQPARDQLQKLKNKYSEQKIFLNHYLAVDIQERKKLFYQ